MKQITSHENTIAWRSIEQALDLLGRPRPLDQGGRVATGQRGPRRKMAGVHLPFRQHAGRQGVAARDFSPRPRQCAVQPCRQLGGLFFLLMRGRLMMSDDDATAMAMRRGDDGGNATITGASARGLGIGFIAARARSLGDRSRHLGRTTDEKTGKRQKARKFIACFRNR